MQKIKEVDMLLENHKINDMSKNAIIKYKILIPFE